MTRFVADDPERYRGQTIGTGHCVPFVHRAAGTPPSAHWRRGPKVRDGGLTKGTAIATFTAQGRYASATDGSSHAAILIADNSDGLLVWDQWVGRPVNQRVIRFRNGVGDAVNDGDQYYAIEAVSTG